MEMLAQRGCNAVLWECGPELAAAAIRQGCVQDVVGVVAPTLMGGVAARTPLADLGFTAMDQVDRSFFESNFILCVKTALVSKYLSTLSKFGSYSS